jgi:glutamyl-tRNA synthetase
MPITRLAPSPTGALHLGNARTFLINWLLARQNHWKIILRIEDLDGPRIKPRADLQAIEDLQWLGLDWDAGPIYQSSRIERYRAAIDDLVAGGFVYPCICTRREIDLAASAPHAEDGATIYPGTCRDRFASIAEARKACGNEPALRFRVSDQSLPWTDEFAGVQEYDAARELGDFVIAKADGTPAYQLAVVVDDADMDVTHIVRGDDLLDSTPRQILLYRALGLERRIPRYHHLPLVVGPDGRRLAKRHGDTRLAHYRETGVAPSRILELLAHWSGIAISNPASARDLLSAFQLGGVPHERIVFDPAEL